MNSPGAIGAGPIVRPFFNRAAVAVGPTIVRTALGTASDNNGVAVTSLSLGPFDLAATETLIVCAFYRDTTFGVDFYQMTYGALTLQNDAGLSVGSLFYQLWSVSANGSAQAAQTLTWDFSGSTLPPESVALMAARYTGLQQPATYQDQQGLGSGAGTDQDSGVTFGATSQAVELAVGLIGTDGRSSDTVGTWQDGFTAGQNRGGTIALPFQMKEGYKVLSAIGSPRSRVTGATSRSWSSMVQTYKGA